jgi:hypothetical protein
MLPGGLIMQTKLTLRMETAIIEGIKAYADRTGRSVSKIAETYFADIVKTNASADIFNYTISADVRSLVGILPATINAKEEYLQHLEEKNS